MDPKNRYAIFEIRSYEPEGFESLLLNAISTIKNGGEGGIRTLGTR